MSDDEDDRFDRWLDANGITRMWFRQTDDGVMIPTYFRADGSEVIPAESYGYGEMTPYTKTGGRA